MNNIITFYNQSVQVETSDRRLISLIESFIADLYTNIQEGRGKDPEPIITEYVGAMTTYNAFLFINTQFRHLIFFLKQRGVDISKSEFVDKRQYETGKVDYELKPSWKLREEQVPVYDFLKDDPTGSKQVPLATGSGKTLIALYTLAKLRNKFCIIVESKFSEKWKGDIVGIHKAKHEEIVLIKGLRGGRKAPKGTEEHPVLEMSIQELVKCARAGDLPWKYYMFSLSTYRNFIKEYELDPEMVIDSIGVTPLELMPLLRMHTLLVDEAHLSFHAVFRTLLYSNVKYHIGLTATLIPRSPAEARAQKALYTGDNVYHDTMLKQYTNFYPTTFRIDRSIIGRVKVTESRDGRSGVYSHSAFEKSIARDKGVYLSYFNLINEQVQKHYIKKLMPNDKCIIFVNLVDTATDLTKYLQAKYPDKKVVRYCADDIYEEMLKGDIIVTTIGSAGTGIDIPGVRAGIQTVSVASPSSNIQSAGRLRELKDRDVSFIWLYCPGLQKQVNHHNQRLEIFEPRALSFTNVQAQTVVERLVA